MRTWEDELLAQGKPVGTAYKCPNCERPTQAFAIVQELDGEWRCTTCRIEEDRDTASPHEADWNDVRGVRAVFMQASDWTQLSDVPQATREAWVDLRQQARDVTNLPTPADALAKLAELRDQGAAT